MVLGQGLLAVLNILELLLLLQIYEVLLVELIFQKLGSHRIDLLLLIKLLF